LVSTDLLFAAEKKKILFGALGFDEDCALLLVPAVWFIIDLQQH
jgi:hypothetical protein